MTDRELLEKILELVEDEFCYHMDCRFIHGKDKPPTFTPEESIQMAERLGRIYSIAHRIHCGACNSREL
jgi:hypothetical protein